ncbi:MAG: CHAP domain-containing protein [Candidatus Gastranaerophilales bacterium]|nr:CHAP domain-containing protein [Candidatus Gastranaerophilales bacterium]
MGLEALKQGFLNYLKELNEKSASSTEYAVNDAEVSVFLYSNEFKDYVKEELSVSSELASMSVNDILNMEVKNGKLVNPNEETSDIFTKTETEEPNSEDTMISDVETEQEQVQSSLTPESNGKEQKQNNSIITDLLNTLFQEQEVIDALDTDTNGKLSEEEINAFLESIQDLDGNKEDISIDDILKSIDEIKNETLKLEAAEESEENEAEEIDGGSSTESSNASSGNSSSHGGSSGGSSGGGSNSNLETSTTSEKDVSKMTMKELTSELEEADTTLKEGEETLNGILDGTEDGIKSRQEAMDKAYETYQEELKVLDEDMAKELDERKEAAEKQEEKVDTKEKEINTQEGVVRDADRDYKEAVSKRESLESTLSSLESALSGASEEEKGSIEAQIASVKAQLEQAKIAEQNAKIALDEAKEALQKLEDEKVELETELTNLEQKVTEYEQEIAEKHPEIAEYQRAYNEAKVERDNYKTQATTALKSDIENVQNYKDKIEAEITTRENQENEKKYNVKGNGEYNAEEGERLVDTAKAMLAKYGSTTGYCATGVSRTISMAYGIQMGGNGNDWDTNMEKLVEQGMFTEVTDDYPSSNDLSNLPAGAIICWESTGGTNGGGAQYGHVAVADGQGGEISDHYQKNIYKSVGGRSDQYRIFIPV